MPDSQREIEDTRPWAFTKSELTAGLRRSTGDPSLQINILRDQEITQLRPAMGRLRGLDVETSGSTGDRSFKLVLKEPKSSSRTGTAGSGLREVSIYRVLSDQLPVRIPELLAAHPKGNWLVLDRLPVGRRPEKWQAADYLLAADQLVAIHDRFWGLGEDLKIYPWLSRPLDFDLNIQLQAAEQSIINLAELSPASMLSEDIELIALIRKIIDQAEKITKFLLDYPTTLLHGDYWPGNIHVHKDGSLTVFDWEKTAIGPGILDLVHFTQLSQWWFEPLPISEDDIIQHYRSQLELANNTRYSVNEWAALWDHAFLWTFLSNWLDLLPSIPNSVLTSRLPQLEGLWLAPLRAAAKRLLS